MIKKRIFTPEHRRKLSESQKGKHLSKETIEKLRNRIISEETRRKISENNKGKIPWNKGLTKEDPRVKKYSDKNIGKKHTEESKNKNRITHLGKVPWIKGKKHTEETKNKLSKLNKGGNITSFKKGHKRSNTGRTYFRKGQVPWNYKGITPINRLIRTSVEYKLWRKAVFERDNYTCIWCGKKFIKGVTGKVILHADHIKPFSLFPELRFAIDNGRTLCIDCHKKTDTYGGKKQL
jgi:hypothetical protein